MLIQSHGQAIVWGAILISLAFAVLMARRVLLRRVSPRPKPWPAVQLGAVGLLTYFCMAVPPIFFPASDWVIPLARAAFPAGCILLVGSLVGTLLALSAGDWRDSTSQIIKWGSSLVALFLFLFYLFVPRS